MADLTVDELAWLRSWVPWADFDDTTDLQARFDRLGSVAEVALEIARERLGQILGEPKSFTVPGQYGQTEHSPADVQRLVDDLSGVVASEGGDTYSDFAVGKLVRPDRR